MIRMICGASGKWNPSLITFFFWRRIPAISFINGPSCSCGFMTSHKSEVNPIWACRGFPAFPVALVGVGNAKENSECNVMTVVLVHMFSFDPPVIGVGISPCRYTYDLLNKYDDFTVN